MNYHDTAFPTTYQENANGGVVQYTNSGITILDYFAAKAMQALLTQKHDINKDYLTEKSYEIAECMMEVRKEFYK